MGYDEALKLQIKEADIFKPYSKEERKRYEREHPIPPPPKGGRKIYIFAKFNDRYGLISNQKLEVDENYLLTICNPKFNEAGAAWLEDDQEFDRYIDVTSVIDGSEINRKYLFKILKQGRLPIEIEHELGGIGLAFMKNEAVVAAKKAFNAGGPEEEGWEDE